MFLKRKNIAIVCIFAFLSMPFVKIFIAIVCEPNVRKRAHN